MPADADILQRLRGRIAAIERGGNGGVRTSDRLSVLPFGVAEVDERLPGGGLATGAVHELLDHDPRDNSQLPEKQSKYRIGPCHQDGPFGAVTAFAAALAGKAQRSRAAPVIWIAPRSAARENLYGPGLLEYGLDPAHLIAVRIAPGGEFTATALWAMEEALRAHTVGLVCAEIEEMNLTASRRLQLAAEAGGSFGLLLRRLSGSSLPPTASVTRWRIASLPGAPVEEAWLPDRLPGRPRWRAELLRARGGRPHSWNLEWRNDRDDRDPGRQPTGGFALASPLRDRPLHSETPAHGSEEYAARPDARHARRA